MKKIAVFEIAENRRIAAETMGLTLLGDCSGITRPGQFVDISLPGKYLRRPISVCSVRGEALTLIYKIVGGGTRQLAAMQPGGTLELLTGLGNGFSVEKSGKTPLLIGGGAGVAPLYALAEALLRAGKKPKAILGFNTADEIFLASELTALGVPSCISTADGSVGVKGFVTEPLDDALIALRGAGEAFELFTCGPDGLLKAVAQRAVGTGMPGWISMDRHMVCGVGACFACIQKVKLPNGDVFNARCCVNGPVFKAEDLVW